MIQRRRRPPRTAGRAVERGAAVVEFTLVSVVLIGLFLAIVQFGLVIHVRNTLTACAAEGARHAANADRSAADGVQRTTRLAADSLGAGLVDDVSGRRVVVDGVALIRIEVRATLPLVGMLGPERGLTLRGHAVDESAW